MKTSLSKYFCAFIILCYTLSCSDDENSSNKVSDRNSTTEEEKPTGKPPIPLSITEEILKLVNEHRQNKGLTKLITNKTAEQLAVTHTEYMISKSTISHDDFSSRKSVLNKKENARSAAENVASFYPDAKSVVAGWLASSGHKKNIEGNYTHTGIAAIKDKDGKYYYTQLFYR